MPIYYNQDVICSKCWRPKMSERNKNGEYEQVLDIGSIIIIMPPSKLHPNGETIWKNICTEHADIIRAWMINSINKLPREIPLRQEKLG